MAKYFFSATCIYLIFVIYGSLVPLDFEALPLGQALDQFRNIRYLNLGIESRADWIANILLYIPLAFFCSATFGKWQQPMSRVLISLVILFFCLSVAVAIEFTQLFFPPRTVSINDLLAETLGTSIGILTWQLRGQYFIKLYQQLLLGSLLSAKAAIIFYLVLYFALSLFPFDFVTSFTELDEKLANSGDHFFLSFELCDNDITRCIVKLLVEALVLLPLGMLICMLPYVTNPILLSLIIGFFLGIAIESIQLFMYSGVAQGISVITRIAGMGLGAIAYSWASKQSFESWSHRLRPMVFLAIVPYVLLIMSINGWLNGSWLTTEQALQKLNATHFLPFYYFYFTTETIALVSLLSNLGSYLPIGLFYWAASLNTPANQKTHWFYVGLSAAAFALIIETGKLFLVEKHVDPTDIAIAFVAAAGTYRFLQRVRQWVAQDLTAPNSPSQPNTTRFYPTQQQIDSNPITPPEASFIDYPYRVLTLFCLAIIIATLVDYPIGAPWLAGFLLAYAYLLLRYPQSWLLVVPALLPVMDFAPWTGWFFWDEFDLLIITTLALYYWNTPKQLLIKPFFSIPTLILIYAFYGVYLISLAKGLLPLAPLDENSFSNYYSKYNGLRVAKGGFWAVLLLPALRHHISYFRHSKHLFTYGMLLGLTGVSLFAIIERLVFVNLWDFNSDYRINALFSTMHTGGGHIESYLMLSMPFIALLFSKTHRQLLSSVLGILLLIISLYTLLMTFSRGGYIGFVVSFSILLLAYWARFGNQLLTKKTLLLLPGLVIVLSMAIPVLRGDLAQQRFSVAEQDQNIRAHHWQDAIGFMDNDILTSLFGMGLGSYPRTFFWLNNEDTHPATYEFTRNNGNPFIRLRGGDAIFIGQYLTIEPQQRYHLSLDVRGESEGLVLSTSLCEKSLQYSLRCSTVENITTSADWQHFEQELNSNDVGDKVANGWLKRPIQLSLYNGNSTGKLLDVDNIKLIDATGVNRLVNGDFSQGHDFWFFSAEKHNPWHIFNFWVHLVFDMGWLGASLFCLLFLKAMINCYRNLHQQDPYFPILLASLSGFIVVGFVDSPFDAPRLTLLFLLLLFLALRRSSGENIN